MLKISHPTKHFCILVPAPFGTLLFPLLFCRDAYYALFSDIMDKFI